MSEENQVQESLTKETEDALYSGSEKQPEGVATEAKEDTSVSEEKVAETEAKEDAKVEEAQAEDKEIEYKLELGKETLLDNSVVEDVTAFAKEHNLSNDVAQKILSKQEETISKFFEAEAKAQEAELSKWRDSVINDNNMGGDNLKKTVEDARRVVERFGSEEFIEILRDTGYGDHPEVVRFLSNLGKIMSDDSLVLPNVKAADRPIEEIFYGKSN